MTATILPFDPLVVFGTPAGLLAAAAAGAANFAMAVLWNCLIPATL